MTKNAHNKKDMSKIEIARFVYSQILHCVARLNKDFDELSIAAPRYIEVDGTRVYAADYLDTEKS